MCRAFASFIVFFGILLTHPLAAQAPANPDRANLEYTLAHYTREAMVGNDAVYRRR